MFTASMTKAEIIEAAKKDYYEMRPRILVAYDRFIRVIRLSAFRRERAIHSILENHTIRTRARNDWNVLFFNNGYDATGRFYAGIIIYIPLHRASGVDYLMLSNIDHFVLELFTAHFMRRYRERYLDYFHINLNGMHPLIYFKINNPDSKLTSFMPEEREKTGEDDDDSKCCFLSKQGLMLARFDNPMFTYITFLEQTDLTRYKAEIYEENELLQIMEAMPMDDFERKQAIFMKLCRDKDRVPRIIERFFRRNLTGRPKEEVEKAIEGLKKDWEKIVEQTFEIEKLLKKQEKSQEAKSLLDLNARRTADFFRKRIYWNT